MTVNTSMIPRSLVPGIHEFVGLSYGDTPEEHLPLYEVLSSKRAFEEEVYVSGMGGAHLKREGMAVEYDDISEAWSTRYTAITIAIGFAVTKEAFDDDQYDTISRAKAQELGRSMADTKQVLAANTYNNGFSSSALGGDGVCLFSTAHPTSSGVNFNNVMTGDFAESTLENALISISKIKNDRGILLSLTAKSLHIPTDLQFVAERVLKSDASTTLAYALQSTSQYGVSNKNDLNAMKSMGKFPGGVHINHRFTDPAAYFIRTSADNGTKMFVREALSGSDDQDFSTDNHLFKFRERYSFGWTDPRQWLGRQGGN